MNTNNAYTWFKLYQSRIKDDAAKYDFLTMIRKEMPIERQHEKFYFEYAMKHKLPYISYGFEKEPLVLTQESAKKG